MLKELVTVRNVGSEPIPLGGQYLWPGEARQVSPHMAESAIANHAERLIKVEKQPDPVPVVEAESPTVVSELPPGPFQPFQDKLFTLAGSFEAGRDFWVGQIEGLGGKIETDLTVETNFLVAGKTPGKKAEQARQMNIPVLTEQELGDFIERTRNLPAKLAE